MPIPCPTCQHTHPNGHRCGSPAMRGELFCFFHHPTRRPPIHHRAAHASFSLPPITDAEDVQIALSEIIKRLAENTITTQRANLIFNMIQAARANLTGLPPARAYPNPDMPDLAGLLSRIVPPSTHPVSKT